jgi:hypothetical protein
MVSQCFVVLGLPALPLPISGPDFLRGRALRIVETTLHAHPHQIIEN